MPEYSPEFQNSLNEVLRLDPSLRDIVDGHVFNAFLHPRQESRSSFEYLARGVISQQVSGAAARSICKSFQELCGSGEDFPSPQQVLEFDALELREAGLSRQKSAYILGLAEAYKSGDISDELLQSLSDDDVVDKIVSLKGFGPWSAQMFLVFYLQRMDVFSPGDVGVQRGMRRYLEQRPELRKGASDLADPPPSPGKSKKSQGKAPLPQDLVHMSRIAHRFTPHRTAFQMILWKLSDIQMDTVEARDNEDLAKRKRETSSAKRRKVDAAKNTDPNTGEDTGGKTNDTLLLTGTEIKVFEPHVNSALNDGQSVESINRVGRADTAQPSELPRRHLRKHAIGARNNSVGINDSDSVKSITARRGSARKKQVK